MASYLNLGVMSSRTAEIYQRCSRRAGNGPIRLSVRSGRGDDGGDVQALGDARAGTLAGQDRPWRGLGPLTEPRASASTPRPRGLDGGLYASLAGLLAER